METVTNKVRTIGLLGGMSFESTLEYYRIINEEVNRLMGGNHSAQIVLSSLDFGLVEMLQHLNEWDKLCDLLCWHAKHQLASADFIVICTNTMHKLAKQIEDACQKEVLHIADVTGKVICEKGIQKVALLGTKFTMQERFYSDKLNEQGIEVLIPTERDCDFVHRVIYDELCKGIIRDESRKGYQWIIEELAERGAEGVVLGCTEIPLLIKEACIPVFDTTRIHAEAAARKSLGV